MSKLPYLLALTMAIMPDIILAAETVQSVDPADRTVTSMEQSPSAAQNSNNWPETLDAAVSTILGNLNPTQKSVIRSASRDYLMVSLAEWAEDVQAELGLRSGNKKLITVVCQGVCSADRATSLITESIWDRLQK